MRKPQKPHLTNDQRELVRILKQHPHNWTYARISSALGYSEKTVRRNIRLEDEQLQTEANQADRFNYLLREEATKRGVDRLTPQEAQTLWQKFERGEI